MKLKLTILFFLTLIFFSCKKDADFYIPCQNKVDFGAFLLSEETDSIFHYPGFISTRLFDLNWQNSIDMNINFPIFNQRYKMTYNRSSDCVSVGGDVEYIYSVAERLVNVTFISEDFTVNPPNVLFRITSVFEEGTETIEKINEGLFLYGGRYYYPTDEQDWLKDDPLASIYLMEDSKNTDAIDEFHSSITLNNNNYQDVYVCSDLNGVAYLQKIYFSLSKGIIGIESEDGKIWTVD